MGELIMMTRTPASPPVRPHTGGDAEILFFTGVRYHRIEDEPQQKRIQGRRRAARKAAALKPERQV